jgi:hypothetical protein
MTEPRVTGDTLRDRKRRNQRDYRARRRRGIELLTIRVPRDQLVAIANKGYGDPDGSQADKVEAVETFLMDFAV